MRFIFGTLFLTVLTGVLIPSTVIAASPMEFVIATNYLHPLWYVASAFCLALGMFMVWFGVFYWLCNRPAKVVFEILVWIACGVAILNYMAFDVDLGNLSNTLQFENALVFDQPTLLINAAIVAAVALVFAILFILAKKLPNFILPVALVAVVCMSGLSVSTIANATGEIESSVSAATSSRASFNLSKNGKNVVVLMLDRAMGEYIPYIMNEKPQIKEQFSGFTYYSNVISFGSHTNFATPALFGGYEYTPAEINKRASESLEAKHNEALKVMPVLFDQNDFEVTVCDPPYAGYQWVSDLSVFDEYPDINAYLTEGLFPSKAETQQLADTIENNKRNFFLYALMKCTPLFAQGIIYNDGIYNNSAMALGTGTQGSAGNSEDAAGSAGASAESPDEGTGSGVDKGVGAEATAEAGAGANVGVGSDATAEGDSDVDANAEAGADVNADAEAGPDVDAEVDAGAENAFDAEADAETGPDAGAETGASAENAFDVEAVTDTVAAGVQVVSDDSLTATGMNGSFMRSYNVLENLGAITRITDSSQNSFMMLANSATHAPVLLQTPDYTLEEVVDNTAYEAANSGRFTVDGITLSMQGKSQVMHYHANMGALLSIGNWLDYLRANGVYDNTRIIIVSDHGADLQQLPGMIYSSASAAYDIEAYYPLLLVKDFNSEGFTESTEFMTNGDVPVLATAGLIGNPTNPFTGKSLTNLGKTAHPQYVFTSHTYSVETNNGNTFLDDAPWLAVWGNMKDMTSWTETPDPNAISTNASSINASSTNASGSSGSQEPASAAPPSA